MGTNTMLKVKVIPGSSTTAIAGWLGETLKVKVSVQPEKGKANRAVVDLIGRALGVNARSIRVVRGATSPLKVIEIDHLSMEEIRRRLG